MACSAAPRLTRGESMSSIRKISRPPRERIDSHASRYVRAFPTCCAPVGDGARRPTREAVLPLILAPPEDAQGDHERDDSVSSQNRRLWPKGHERLPFEHDPAE